jgi:hypothetical protein
MNQNEKSQRADETAAAISRQLRSEESGKERFAAHVGRFAERVQEN